MLQCHLGHPARASRSLRHQLFAPHLAASMSGTSVEAPCQCVRCFTHPKNDARPSPVCVAAMAASLRNGGVPEKKPRSGRSFQAREDIWPFIQQLAMTRGHRFAGRPASAVKAMYQPTQAWKKSRYIEIRGERRPPGLRILPRVKAAADLCRRFILATRTRCCGS
jgi:hypothetical protein